MNEYIYKNFLRDVYEARKNNTVDKLLNKLDAMNFSAYLELLYSAITITKAEYLYFLIVPSQNITISDELLISNFIILCNLGFYDTKNGIETKFWCRTTGKNHNDNKLFDVDLDFSYNFKTEKLTLLNYDFIKENVNINIDKHIKDFLTYISKKCEIVK